MPEPREIRDNHQRPLGLGCPHVDEPESQPTARKYGDQRRPGVMPVFSDHRGRDFRGAGSWRDEWRATTARRHRIRTAAVHDRSRKDGGETPPPPSYWLAPYFSSQLRTCACAWRSMTIAG